VAGEFALPLGSLQYQAGLQQELKIPEIAMAKAVASMKTVIERSL